MKDHPSLPDGVTHWPGYLDESAQKELLTAIRKGVSQAPLFVPCMPKTGKEMSVKMSNFGPLGWVTDKKDGYRYQPTHPITGKPWPTIPQTAFPKLQPWAHALVLDCGRI